MAKTPKEYTRLGGRGMRRAGFRFFVASRAVYTLWMGRDHLLLVERIGYTETYKRFYFADIQAIIMRKTSTATIFGVIAGIMVLLFGVPALMLPDPAGRITVGIVAGFFGLLFLVNLWRGPSCVTHIQTAVQTEQLPSWSRVRAVRKALDQLRPRLRETQGEYLPETLRAQWLEGLSGGTQTPDGGTT
jgi:hypothetical protein